MITISSGPTAPFEETLVVFSNDYGVPGAVVSPKDVVVHAESVRAQRHIMRGSRELLCMVRDLHGFLQLVRELVSLVVAAWR